MWQTASTLTSKSRLTIDTKAIHYNLSVLQELLPPHSRIMAMVKANGYGVGLAPLVRTLFQYGVDIFGFASVSEALTLQDPSGSLFVLHATEEEYAPLIEKGFEVGVSNRSMISQLNAEALRQRKQCKVHLHVDTGMSRFGCRPEEAASLGQAIEHSPGLLFEGIMTHFAAAEDPREDSFTQEQAHRLFQCQQQLHLQKIRPRWTHLCNTAGSLRHPQAHGNMVRVGLALFGLHSSPDVARVSPFRMALTLSTQLVDIKTCREGDTISYGRKYCVRQKEQRIGVLPLGHHDGFHVCYSGCSEALIHGVRVPFIGVICMDYLMLDLTDVPQARIGDEVTLFGYDRQSGLQVRPETFGNVNYRKVHQFLCCLGPRIQRIFTEEEGL